MADESYELFTKYSEWGAEDYRETILEHLKTKYGCDFHINQILNEFDGDSGLYVRAICNSDAYADKFLVRCFVDSNIAEERIIVFDHEHSISDEYLGVMYQNIILKQLGFADTDDCIVRCRVDFYGEPPIVYDDIRDGMEACIQNRKKMTYIKLFIFSADKDKCAEIQNKATELITKLNPYTGYIYVCAVDKFDAEKVLKEYDEHQHDFGNYISSGRLVKDFEFCCYNTDDGWADKKIVKR